MCKVAAPPRYSEDPASVLYREAREVYDMGRNLTPEQTAIARFWSDDPGLTATPGGHSGPYTRATIDIGDHAAQAYPVREPERWLELVRPNRVDM
jgi:hypothetical protein